MRTDVDPGIGLHNGAAESFLQRQSTAVSMCNRVIEQGSLSPSLGRMENSVSSAAAAVALLIASADDPADT
jgi:hypothetical protein